MHLLGGTGSGPSGMSMCRAESDETSSASPSTTISNASVAAAVGNGSRPSKRATSRPDPAGGQRKSSSSRDSSKRSQGQSSSADGSRDSRDHHGRRVSSSTLSALLEPFSSKNAGSIPSSSRAGADIAQQRTANQIGLLESWKYIPFLAHQATSLATAFVSHHLFGPPKKSWGIELTLFTTAVRESVQFSHLSSLGQLRKFLNLGQILPVPKDGVVTPVTFRVKKRGLIGLLEAADAKEDGTRELTGEWVVSRRIWRRLQHEHYGAISPAQPNDVPYASPAASTSHRGYHPSTSAASTRDKVILYLHGGAYYVMSAATHRYITISVSKYTDCRVFAVNYRLAPECKWPGQIHDAVAAYLRLTQDLKIPSENIIFAGDSAGGGLCLATMMYLRDNNLPLPCGAILMSPWVDLSMSCDSWETNAQFDYLRMPSGDDHMNPIASYLGAENVKRLITHPYVSPLFGDFNGMPPMLIQCGDAECLRDEGTLLAHKASLAGVQVYHEVYEDCPHVFQALFFLDAAKKAFRSHRHFVKRVLPSLQKTHTVLDTDRLDKEVMSDAHAIRADGQAEEQSLPASPETSMRSVTSTDMDVDFDDSDDRASYSAASSSQGGDADVRTFSDSEEPVLLRAGKVVQEKASTAVSKALGSMIQIGSKASGQGTQHHDLDKVGQEQDDHLSRVEARERRHQPSHPSRSNSSSNLLQAQQQHHGTITWSANVASAPTSPSALKNRHRSLSSLSLTSLTPTHSVMPLPGSDTSQPTSPASGTMDSGRPTHSRQGSSASIASTYTARPGLFRENSRPRARANSHPDLQALLDSYEQTAPQHQTVLFRPESSEGREEEEDDDDDDDADFSNRTESEVSTSDGTPSPMATPEPAQENARAPHYAF